MPDFCDVYDVDRYIRIYPQSPIVLYYLLSLALRSYDSLTHQHVQFCGAPSYWLLSPHIYH